MTAPATATAGTEGPAPAGLYTYTTRTLDSAELDRIAAAADAAERSPSPADTAAHLERLVLVIDYALTMGHAADAETESNAERLRSQLETAYRATAAAADLESLALTLDGGDFLSRRSAERLQAAKRLALRVAGWHLDHEPLT